MTVFGVYAYALYSVIPSGATKRRRAYLRRGNRAPAAVCMRKTLQKMLLYAVKGLVRTYRASRFVALGEIRSTRLCGLARDDNVIWCACEHTKYCIACEMRQIGIYR